MVCCMESTRRSNGRRRAVDRRVGISSGPCPLTPFLSSISDPVSALHTQERNFNPSYFADVDESAAVADARLDSPCTKAEWTSLHTVESLTADRGDKKAMMDAIGSLHADYVNAGLETQKK